MLALGARYDPHAVLGARVAPLASPADDADAPAPHSPRHVGSDDA
jgi:hypothetical protein